MASETASQTNGYGAHYASSEATNTTTNASGNGSTESSSPSKNEIGWYFVEQYYTTLSKNPEKLHLFYAKRSQFVSGLEAEKTPVCVGQHAIAERISQLDIKDAKVRVTNVDSQESGRDIVAQVIGEMSNKGLPHRKFVQTFILAEQPNGYYVLNDIFRYVADEDEEELDEQTAEEVPEAEPATLSSTDDTEKQEKDVEILDKKLEETAAEPEIEPSAIAAATNEAPAEPETSEPVKETVVEQPTEAATEDAAKAVAQEEEQVTEEKPKDPEPSPAVASPPKQAATPVSVPASETSAPAKPAVPKTWASMLAGNKSVAVPQVPVQAPSQPKAALKSAPTPAPEAISAPGVAATVAGLTDDTQAPPSPGGWQTAGQEHNRKQHRQQPSALGGQADTTSAYIKNVTEKVDAVLLKQTLTKFGKLAYFDVSRPKNCAFVEFESQSAFQAAVAANPHMINGVEVIVAERLRSGNGFPRSGSSRGGRGGMENRTNSQGGRGGFNKDGRGNFANRGARGGAPTQRGRGGAQAA